MDIHYEVGQIVYWHGGRGPILEINQSTGEALVEDVTLNDHVPIDEKRMYKKISELYPTLSSQQADYFYDEIDRH